MSSKFIIETKKNIPPPPPPPPQHPNARAQVSANVPPPPPPPPKYNLQNMKTIQMKVPIAPPPPPPEHHSSKPKQQEKVSEALTNPLELLLNNEGKELAAPKLDKSAVDDAHKFSEIFGNIIQNTNSLNSISNILNDDDYDEDPIGSRKKLTSSILAKFAAPQMAEAPKEEIISTPSIVSFTPSVSINFTRSVYTTLQGCIDQAPAKAYIKIQSGIYPERLQINKEVILDGVGEVIIYGADITKNCSISKVIFKCDNKGKGGDVVVSGNAVTSFQNVTFLTNEINAISLKDKSLTNLFECTVTSLQLPCMFTNSEASVAATSTVFDGSQSYGILIADNSSVRLDKCICRRNQKAAICTTHKSEIVINSSRIELNNNGIEANSTGQLQILSSSVSNNSNVGVYIACRCFVTTRNSQYVDNLNGAVASSKSGIFFSFDSFFKDSAGHPLIFISDKSFLSSSGDSYIGKCLSAIAASDGSEVYLENGKMDVLGSGCIGANCSLTIKQAAIKTIAFGFQVAQSTIDLQGLSLNTAGTSISLSECVGSVINTAVAGESGCDLTATDAKFIKIGLKCRSKAVIVSGGKPVFEQCALESNAVGAEVISGSPIFKLCSFNLNISHIHAVGGSAILDGCRIYSSHQFGLTAKGASLVVSQCEINGNKGAIDASESKVFVDRSVFTNNGIVAIQLRNRTAAKIGVCHFSGQQKSITTASSSIDVSDCLFESSQSTHIEIYASNMKISNTTMGATELAIKTMDSVNLVLEKVAFNQCKQAVQVDAKGVIEVKDSQLNNCQVGFEINGSASVSNTTIANVLTPFLGKIENIKKENVTM